MTSLKKAFSLYKKDIKTITTNWAALLIMSGLIMLPPLYAWFNIAACIDPYANTGVLKIGVISYDTGADINGTHINAGNDVMNELRENKSLDWIFYKTEDEAVNAVRMGNAYAAVIIPKDFSQDLISVTSNVPKKAVIDYYENDKINAITPKIMQKGAETLQEEINESFISAASKVVLAELQAAGVELSSNESKMLEYKQDLYELDGRMPDIIFTLDNAVKILDKNLDAAPRIRQRLPMVRGMLNESLIMSDNINDTLDNATVNMQGTKRLVERNYDLIKSLLSQSADIGADLIDLSKGGHKFLNHLLKDASKSVRNINAAMPGIKKDLDDMHDLSEATKDEALKHIGDIEKLLSDYDDFFKDAESKIGAAGTDYKQLADTIIAFNKDLKDAFDALEQNMPIPLPDDIQQNLDYLDGIISRFWSAVSQDDLGKEMTSAIDLVLESIDSADSLLDDYYGTIGSIHAISGASHLDLSLNQLTAIKKTLAQYRKYLVALRAESDNGEKAQAYIAEINKLLLSLEEQMRWFETDYLNVIAPSLNSIKGDARVIKSDATALLRLLINDLNLFESLISEAEQTGKDVDGYLKKLQSTLPGAQGDISSIADKLRSFDDMYSLDNIIDALVSSDEEKKDFLASPTTLNTTKLFPIPNYGSASTPFYTVLALWVGTLLLSSMLRLEVGEEYTSTQQFIGKYLLFFTATQLQALVVTIGDLLVVKVYAAEPVLFVLLGMFTSFIFSMIVFSLVSVFGNIGKALGVVMLVLQLSASGGTFPIELTPGFFQAVHPYLPFTYAINAVREAVGGVIPELLLKNIKYLIIFYVLAAIFGLRFKEPINKLGRGFAEKLKESGIFEG